MCKIKEGNLVPKEYEAAKWITVGDIDWLLSDRDIIKKIEDRLCESELEL